MYMIGYNRSTTTGSRFVAYRCSHCGPLPTGGSHQMDCPMSNYKTVEYKTIELEGVIIKSPIDGQGPSIECPKCGMESYHPKDIKHRYCGNCHQFHDMMELDGQLDGLFE